MIRLISLTFAAFAIGISEFVLVGLLPTIAVDSIEHTLAVRRARRRDRQAAHCNRGGQ